MTRKGVNQFTTDVLNEYSMIRNPMTEMGRGPQCQLSGALSIAGRVQPLGEIVQVFTDRALPQLT
jgi:hypothetical protein